MIFTGDISQPYTRASRYKIPDGLRTRLWFGNLEGSLICESVPHGVYNASEAIAALCRDIPFKAFSIANNHLFDAADIKTTRTNGERTGLQLSGGGNILQASVPALLIDEEKTAFRILTFGWENISCQLATQTREGVNPYTKRNVMQCVKDVLNAYGLKGGKVICFFHWNYELERYPQPYDRHLAHELIDMGVEAVIGCHAHRVQPIEFYKGKPIVYGLGNFLFCQGHYFNGKLIFPKFCEEEYAFEVSKEGYKLHYFHYDQNENRLEYIKSEDICSETEFDGKAVFTGFSDKKYEKWFKQHRVQKRLLPIFHTHENAMSYWLKSEWIKVRGGLINLLTTMNLKSRNRSNR